MSKSYETEDIEQAERELADHCQQVYAKHYSDKQIIPRFPYVLVRVLPREQKYGSLILPDTAMGITQNKPTNEGIVLAVWEPKTEKLKSELEVGDHVVFPSFAGQPVPHMNENDYRLVPEPLRTNGVVTVDNSAPCILGKVNYKNNSAELFSLLTHETGMNTMTASLAVEDIEKRFHLVPKHQEAKILSGK